jgi:hypothetical protein
MAVPISGAKTETLNSSTVLRTCASSSLHAGGSAARQSGPVELLGLLRVGDVAERDTLRLAILLLKVQGRVIEAGHPLLAGLHLVLQQGSGTSPCCPIDCIEILLR